MKYFLDTEFHEYKKQPTICGIKVGKPIDTIELISIGIVSEGEKLSPLTQENIGRSFANAFKGGDFPEEKTYYAICKDFDLKAAWNNEWLRENVLKSILKELEIMHKLHVESFDSYTEVYLSVQNVIGVKESSEYLKLMRLLDKYGKTREQIAEEILKFVYITEGGADEGLTRKFIEVALIPLDIKFHAYYADYDWVVFCWLFGRMIDLPKGFPMYCNDLKQMLDERQEIFDKEQYKLYRENSMNPDTNLGMNNKYTHPKLKDLPGYPEQINEHNALDDAKWNKKLYNFLNMIS